MMKKLQKSQNTDNERCVYYFLFFMYKGISSILLVLVPFIYIPLGLSKVVTFTFYHLANPFLTKLTF